MKRLLKNLKYVIAGSIILIIIFFDFVVFRPMQEELDANLKTQFKQQLSIAEINLENYIKQQINETKSLTSRTMIRKKLAQYKTGELKLQDLKEYTQPKYNDGVEILKNILGAYRISEQELIASWGNTETIKLKDYYNLNSKTTTVKISLAEDLLVIVAPIYQDENLLGYDIASFDLKNSLKQLNTGDIRYQLADDSDLSLGFKETSQNLKSLRQILDTNYYLKAVMSKDNLYQTVNHFYILIIIATVFSLVLVGVLSKLIIDKTSKQIIYELEEKNKKINQSLNYHRRYTKLFNNINNGVAVYDAVNDGEDFVFVDINKAGQKMDNLSKEELIGKSIKEVFPGVKEFGLFYVLKRVYQTGNPEKIPIKRYRDNRISVYRENYVYKLPTGEVVAVYEDLTAEKKREKELKETKEQLEMAIEGANLGLWDWNPQTGDIELNDNWLEMIGYENQSLDHTYQAWKDKIHPEDKERVMNRLNKHLSGTIDFYECEYRLETESGDWKWIKAMGKVMERDENGNPSRVVGVHQDIDDRKKAEKRIKYLSFHDELTNLYNRRYFEEEQKKLNNSRKFPISIIVGDMNRLKYINDTYGHQKGDQYIKKAAQVFKSVTREEDVVARIGGDEFAVLLRKTNSNEAQKFYDRFYEQLKDFNSKTELEEKINISLGYATAETKEQDLNKVFDQADQNMYKNKESKR